MQFLVLGYDGDDDKALDRRLAVRADHLALGDEMTARGEMLVGFAMLDDSGKMRGSAIVVDLPDRAAVDAWLEVEPYVTGDVWRRIEVTLCKVGPSCESMFPSS
jgi:uncharacterized protein